MAFTFCSLLSFVFVFTAQAVLTHARLTFRFTSGIVRQCEPLSITFDGMPGDEAQRPSSLSILPLGYPPVVFPLRQGTSTSDTLLLAALPFPAGTKFLATMEDNQGRGLSSVSDLMTISPSTSDGNTSCLPSGSSTTQNNSRVLGNPSQCQEFTVLYDNSTSPREPPRVTVYSPGGISLRLNSTAADLGAGSAKYLMAVSREKKVILLIDGSNGIRETTSFITVSGDESSPSDCLQAQTDAEVALIGRPTIVNTRTIIIGAAAGGGAVILIALAMTFFILNDRRKRRIRRLQLLSFDGSRMVKSPSSPLEKAPLPQSPPPPPRRPAPPSPRDVLNTASVVDPAYPTPAALLQRGFTRSGDKNWSWVIPEDTEWQQRPGVQASGHRPGRPSIASETRNVAPTDYESSDRLSINSLDIEGMLNMAAVQSAETRSRKSSIPMLFGSQETIGVLGSPSGSLSSTPAPINTQRANAEGRRELKVNSDIPAGALSTTTSLYDSYYDTGPTSTSSSRMPNPNPFMPEESIVIQAGRRYQPPSSPLRLTTPQGRTPGGSLGLPISPRSVRLAPGRASIGGSSRRSSLDWYGVGIAR